MSFLVTFVLWYELFDLQNILQIHILGGRSILKHSSTRKCVQLPLQTWILWTFQFRQFKNWRGACNLCCHTTQYGGSSLEQRILLGIIVFPISSCYIYQKNLEKSSYIIFIFQEIFPFLTVPFFRGHPVTSFWFEIKKPVLLLALGLV